MYLYWDIIYLFETIVSKVSLSSSAFLIRNILSVIFSWDQLLD